MTEVNFCSPHGDYFIPLHDMGGGIEQLLMAATVLLTTGDESTIFLEEPESHLHAGAQRFLIDRLYEGDRQVFITTHSPTFVNHPRPRSLYQVRYQEGRTTISRVSDTDSLSLLLEDIGARNSDVLLSDAVCFVEGPGDRDALRAWSETLGQSLSERNVTLLPMGGGEYAERGARMRSDVLAGISQKAPVPHLFILDKDERSEAEVRRLQQTLGNQVQFLGRRELENYLLIPRALLAALTAKFRDNKSLLERIQQTTPEQIEQLMRTTAEGLYGLILLKRIRAQVEGLKGGLLPREIIASLSLNAHNRNLAAQLQKMIKAHIKEHLTGLDIASIVEQQRAILDSEWSDPTNRLSIAPGEEILEAVFHHFGAYYKKPQDTVQIARAMNAEDIDPEITHIIDQVIQLRSRTEAASPSKVS
jgi:hypothetical protein